MAWRSALMGGWRLKSSGGGSAEDAAEQDSLELRDGRRVALTLRKKNCSLQRRQDEVADLLALETFWEVACLHGGLQASFQRILNDVENLDQAGPDRLLASCGLRGGERVQQL